MRILEIGTGPYALLSVYFSKKYDCEFDACDINEEYIQSSKVIAEKNNSKINLFVSNLFANASGLYDMIFFNSVYIPKCKGVQLGIDKLHNYRSDWCGGEKGYEVIENYLENSLLHIKNDGVIILGVNYLYLDKLSLNDIICKYKIRIEKEYSNKLNPSSILLLKKI